MPSYQRERVAAAKDFVVQVESVAVTANDGKQANLAIIGSIADQVSTLSGRGHNIHLVISGAEALAKRVTNAFSALLGIKEPVGTGQLVISTLVGESTLAEQVAKQASAGLLIYLSHAPGVPSSEPGKVMPTYDPATSSTSPSCQPGAALVEAAWKLAQQTCPVVMARAGETDVVDRIVAGQEVGTVFDHHALSGAAGMAAANGRASANGSAAACASHTVSAHGGSGASSSGRDMAVRARAASRALQALPTAERVAMLNRVADALLANQDAILAENALDVEEATGKVAESLLQRLGLKAAKIQMLADGIRAIAAQEEPIGRLVSRTEVAGGLVLDKVTAPIGVLLIIFEARPDALPQIASLALRSGNGLLLKGGKEASRSNAILHRVITQAIGALGPDLISLVHTRDEINDLLALDDVIDLVIPRGGNALVSYIQRNTKIPVLGHADGICHIYVDEAANLDMAVKLVVDAKVDYPAACNAVEKVLVHASWVERGGLKAIVEALQAAGVEVHAGTPSAAPPPPLAGLPAAPAPRHEYSALAVTVELVESMADAVDHIHAHGSSHTECIVTDDVQRAEAFLKAVDSACVFHNASTRFADGFRFGLGAEVGISTGRIHARGPVGVEGLLTTKWLMRGGGHVVAKDQGITYTHRALDIKGMEFFDFDPAARGKGGLTEVLSICAGFCAPVIEEYSAICTLLLFGNKRSEDKLRAITDARHLQSKLKPATEQDGRRNAAAAAAARRTMSRAAAARIAHSLQAACERRNAELDAWLASPERVRPSAAYMAALEAAAAAARPAAKPGRPTPRPASSSSSSTSPRTGSPSPSTLPSPSSKRGSSGGASATTVLPPALEQPPYTALCCVSMPSASEALAASMPSMYPTHRLSSSLSPTPCRSLRRPKAEGGWLPPSQRQPTEVVAAAAP